jgi:hypothetical protein
VTSIIVAAVTAFATARSTASAQTESTLVSSGADVAKLKQELAALQTEVARASANVVAVPVGTIVAWWARDGHIPAGWAICDGSNGTPNLRGRFVRGTGNIADNGKDGGQTEHVHGGTAGPDLTTLGWSQGKNFQMGGNNTFNHSHPVSTTSASNLPPYTDIVYIMRLQ